MNPYVILAGVLAFALSIGGSYIYGRHDGREIQIAAQAKVEAVATRIRDEVATKTAEQIAGIEVRHTTIRQRVETEIREKPVYRECAHDSTTFSLLNHALTDASAEPVAAGDRELPQADATR